MVLVVSLWALGYPDKALEQTREAVTYAQELSHPYSTAYAHFFASMIHGLRGEWEATQKQAEQSIKIATEQRLVYISLVSMIPLGLAASMRRRDQAEEGIGQINQSLAAVRSSGVGMAQIYALAQLCWLFWKLERTEEGYTAVAEAMGMAIPGSVSIPAADRRNEAFAHQAGAVLYGLIEKGIKPRDIMTQDDWIVSEVARKLDPRLEIDRGGFRLR